MDFGDCGTRHVIANVCWEVVSLFCKRKEIACAVLIWGSDWKMDMGCGKWV